jgi:two-component system sensor histidine kinase MprB
MTLRTRLAVLAAASAAVATLVISVVLLAVYAGGVRSRGDAALIAAAAQADDIATSVKRQAALSAKTPSFDKPLTIGAVSLDLLPDGVPLASPMAAGPLTERDAGIARREFPAGLDTRSVGGASYRVYAMPMGGAGGGLVRASEPVATGTRSVVRFGLLLAAFVAAATVMAGVLGRAIAGRALRPITRLTRTAEAITATGDPAYRPDARPDPGVRSDADRHPDGGSDAGRGPGGGSDAGRGPGGGSDAGRGPGGGSDADRGGGGGSDAGRGDEVARLASSFTAMLAALERSVEAQRQLVADASHELRTPLTSLRTDLDLLCDPPGLADPRAPQFAERARRRTVELSDLVADLVSLARYGRRPQVVQDVRLDEVVEAAAARVRDRTPPRALSLDLEPTLVVGDEEALYRAVANLLDNAVAWTPAEGDIAVTLRDGRLCVSDTGPGIPAEDLPHVFERFYRSPAARLKPGSGLGLAIVAAVAAAHGGTATASSGATGSRMVLALPEAPDA